MADKIRGVTIEIGGDTSGLSKSLKDANKEIKSTQSQLKDVQKLLKLDPSNIELLKQREQLLNKEIGSTKTKLDELKKTQANMDANGVDKNSEQYMALRREIINTEQSLSDLEEEAARSNATLSQVSAVTEKVATKTGELASKTKALSAAAAGALGALGAAAYKSVTAADDLNTLAKQTGFTTDALQKMEYAADLMDVSVDDITGASKRLKKNLTSTSSDVQEAFAQLGVSIKDSSGEFRDMDDIFFDVVGALGDVANETERDTIAMTLFGKSADSLAGIIDDGGAAFRELGDQAAELGLIMDQETLDSLNAVNDEIDTLKANAKGTLAKTGAKALEAMLPVVEKLVNAISRVLEIIGEMNPETIRLITTILAITAAVSPVLSIISKVSSGISFLTGTLIPKLIPLLGGISLPILGIVAAVAAVIAIFALFGDKISAALDNVSSWIHDKLDKDWTEVFGSAGNIVNGFVQTFLGVWDVIKSALQGVIDFVYNVFQGNWNEAWESIKKAFQGIWDGFVTIVKAPINAMIGMVNSLIDGLNSLISTINKIPGVNIPTVGKIPMLASGGVLSRGSAIVGEAGPELLTMQGSHAVVQPLSGNSNHRAASTVNVYTQEMTAAQVDYLIRRVNAGLGAMA